jgi:hypothetical protein
VVDVDGGAVSGLQIPDIDVLGQPTGSSRVIRSHWAVLISTPVNDVPGPHLLACQDETSARRRLAWWQTNRPDAEPKLVRRRIVETFEEWEPA